MGKCVLVGDRGSTVRAVREVWQQAYACSAQRPYLPSMENTAVLAAVYGGTIPYNPVLVDECGIAGVAPRVQRGNRAVTCDCELRITHKEKSLLVSELHGLPRVAQGILFFSKTALKHLLHLEPPGAMEAIQLRVLGTVGE